MEDDRPQADRITRLPYYEGTPDYDFSALAYQTAPPSRQPLRDFWITGRGIVDGCYRISGGTKHD